MFFLNLFSYKIHLVSWDSISSYLFSIGNSSCRLWIYVWDACIFFRWTTMYAFNYVFMWSSYQRL